MSPRRIAFLVFPRMTLLDLVGPYDVLRRVRTMGIDPNLEWRFVGTQPDVIDDSGTPVHVDEVFPPLEAFDMLVIPGGFGVDELRLDPATVGYLRAWDSQKPVAAVCSGSLLLGDQGWLTGRRATTHHSRLEQLRPLCGQVLPSARVVDEAPIFTSGGVTCGIDLALHLVARYWGPDDAHRIASQIEWVSPALVAGRHGLGRGSGWSLARVTPAVGRSMTDLPPGPSSGAEGEQLRA